MISDVQDTSTSPFVVVLGVAQDAGHPQAGCQSSCCEPAWRDARLGHRVACLGIVDPVSGESWLIDATPDLPSQLHQLASFTGQRPGAPSGILLTHAHTGHYTGLIHLGREGMGARSVPVHAMPRMSKLLEGSAPWEQLLRTGCVELCSLQAGHRLSLNDRLAVRPLLVPHRDEYSETVAFEIEGPGGSALYLPDIDSWEDWDTPIETVLQRHDVAFLDGTFFSQRELFGRSMAEVAHPLVEGSMDRFAALPTEQRSKIRFIHLNHTNPLLDPSSAELKRVLGAGLGVAAEGERVRL